MKNILKYIFNIEMIKIYLVNILFADTALLVFIIMIIAIFPGIWEGPISWKWLCVGFLVMIGRLFVLPIFYNKLEKSEPNEYTKKFLYNLRHSIKTKILVLIISPIPLMIEMGLVNGTYNDFQYLLTMYGFSLVFGLFGSYVVLFLYWCIKDKINKKAG